MADTAARQRQAYDTLLRTGNDAPFIDERPALFSPAAVAQDDANPKGAFGRFAQLLLPQEYADGWLAEKPGPRPVGLPGRLDLAEQGDRARTAGARPAPSPVSSWWRWLCRPVVCLRAWKLCRPGWLP